MILAEGDRQMHDVPRLWVDGVLDAAIAAVEHTHKCTPATSRSGTRNSAHAIKR